MRLVCKEWAAFLADDDQWEDKISMLVVSYPSMIQLGRHPSESAMHAYARYLCALGIDNFRVLSNAERAKAHLAGKQPYLKLYGVVEGFNYSPYSHQVQ